MHEQAKLSLFTVVLININIMIGTGLFINTTRLAQSSGVLSSLSYLIVGILLLPLILSIAQLMNIYPAGGFFVFGSQGLNPFAGFISTWSYFFAKLGSAVVGIHTFVSIVQQLIPLFAQVSPLVCDSFLLILFVMLNLLNVKTGSKIQIWMMVAKMTPIVFLICTGIFIFDTRNLALAASNWQAIPSTLPLVLFSLLGFEAACSLSKNIENAPINGSRAILFSYAIVLAIACTYQFIFYGALGEQFLSFIDYRDAFPALMDRLFDMPIMQNSLAALAQFAIGSSALSGAYGILFTNQWNLHTLADKNYLIGSSFFRQLNKHHIPFICIIAQGVICFCYLIITHGKLVILQQMAALGCTLTYTISTIALIATLRRRKAAYYLPLAGLASCSLLLSIIVYNLMHNGVATLATFAGILSIGIALFFIRRSTHTPQHHQQIHH